MYLDQVDAVMRKVNSVMEMIEMMPYAVFLMTESQGQVVQFDTSERGTMAPTMVCISFSL